MENYLNQLFSILSRLQIAVATITCCLFSACTSENKSVVNVDLKNSNSYLEGKKVYLGDVATKDFLDSAIVKDGKFSLSVRADSGFVPFEASLLYATGDKNYPYWLIGFKNPYLEKTYVSHFYCDRGEVNLAVDTTSNFKKKEIFNLNFEKLNKQTEASYKQFAFLKPSGDKARAHNTAIINAYPTSVALISQLGWQKADFNDAELNELLALFKADVQAFPVYKKLKMHIGYKNTDSTAFPEQVELFRPDFSPARSITDPEKFNLILFWASWCGPCRKEIPQVRRLFDSHHSNLNIVSISIDHRDEAWKKALAQEKMPWSQMIVRRDSSYVKFDKKYDLNSIPVWILTDSKGKLIARHVGLESGDDAIDKKIERLLSKR